MEKPLPAYAGAEPFVFVCYSHADNAVVYPEILRLQSQGFRIWYDDGIAPGSEWNEAIASAIERCAVFLYLITPNAVASEHCRREVNFALEQSCSMLAVHLAETSVPSALKLSLSHRQAILKYDLPPERYESRIHKALSDAAEGREDRGEALSQALRIGEFVLDIASQRLIQGDDTRLLDPKDMSVLLHLAEASPGLVSTEELLNRSWPGSFVGDNVVHQVIGRLRKAFGDKARDPSYIETLPRRGYRLLKEVEPHEPSASHRPPESPPQIEQSADVSEPAPAPQPAARHTPGHNGSAGTLLGRWRLLIAGILALAVAAAGLALWFTRQSEAVHPRSIAVLDFTDLSATGDLGRISSDIATFVSNELRPHQDFYLVSRTAAQQFRDSSEDIQDIGEALGAAFLLTGTVLRDGPRLRVTMELVNVETLGQQWGDIAYGSATDALDTGKDIAVEAARNIARSFHTDTPSLQVTQAEPENTTKPSLQDLFDKEPDEPTASELPSFDDVDVQSFDDFGDVE